MLEFLRKSAGSWVAKGLFILLILSFGVWGIGDVVRSSGAPKAAIVVGDVEVSPAAVRQAFDQKVEQFRGFLGDQMTRETARQMGLADATVRELAQTATMDMLAKDMGITVSDDAVRAEIVKTRAFYDQGGKFSPEIFRAKLMQANLTESGYVAMLRDSLRRERIESLIATPPAVPAALADPVFRHDQERRTAESLTVHPAALTVTGKPGAEDLEKLYKEHIQEFTAPEYRKITVLTLSHQQMESRVQVSEQDITDHYTANKTSFATPEQRSVIQVRVQDEATAADIAAKVRGGMSLADAAAAVKASAPTSMGTVGPGALPEEADKTVFALTVGGITDPIHSPLGWHVFSITAIAPPQQQTLAQVHDGIATSLRQERAIDKVYEESKTLQDTLGGGASLEEAASKLGLTLFTIEQTDIDGKAPNGDFAKGLPSDAALGQSVLKAAFPLQTGEESPLQEMSNGYFIARADSITPPTPRPQDSVANELRQLWTSQQQAAQASAKADELAKKIDGGAAMASLAQAPAVTYSKHSPLTRDGQPVPSADLQPNPLLSPAQVKQVFSLTTVGASAVVATENGPTVVRLSAIEKADPAQNKDKLDALREQLASGLAQDIASEALDAYGARFGVKVNQSVIDQAL